MIKKRKQRELAGAGGKFPYAMTRKALIFYIIIIILVGLFFFFIRGDLPGKMVACFVCPMMIIYMIYAYRKEKKADKNASQKNNRIMEGTYFESPEWHGEYVKYRNAHPFERPRYSSMKLDLLKRFQRREYRVGMLLMFFLMCCSCCGIPMGQYALTVVGMCLFGFFFYLEFALFIGMPVRKWLKRDIDYKELEKSYLNSQMLLYKKNGLAFGTTHIHGFTEKKIYAIDYRLVEGISRKIVRHKRYEDGIYSSEEYEHFAVIRVRLPQSGKIHNVEIELNEFQVQMAIDKLPTYKLGEELHETLTLNEQRENEFV
jgi:hypothetical protein